MHVCSQFNFPRHDDSSEEWIIRTIGVEPGRFKVRIAPGNDAREIAGFHDIPAPGIDEVYQLLSVVIPDHHPIMTDGITVGIKSHQNDYGIVIGDKALEFIQPGNSG
jgi:hypothetical protein